MSWCACRQSTCRSQRLLLSGGGKSVIKVRRFLVLCVLFRLSHALIHDPQVTRSRIQINNPHMALCIIIGGGRRGACQVFTVQQLHYGVTRELDRSPLPCNVPRVVSVKSLTKVTEAKVHTDAWAIIGRSYHWCDVAVMVTTSEKRGLALQRGYGISLMHNCYYQLRHVVPPPSNNDVQYITK